MSNPSQVKVPVATVAPPLPPKKTSRIVVIGMLLVGPILAAMLLCGGVGLGFYWHYNSPGTFDENDLEATKRWASSASRDFTAFMRNDVAFKDAKTNFNDNCKVLTGKTCRWHVQVLRVTDKYVELAGGGLRFNPQHPNFGSHCVSVHNRPKETWANYMSHEPALSFEIGQNISRERAAALVPGSYVPIVGKIREVTAVGDHPTIVCISIELKDLKLQ